MATNCCDQNSQITISVSSNAPINLGYDGVVYTTEEYYSDCWVIIQPYIETDLPPIVLTSYNTVIQNICTAGVGSICPQCISTPSPTPTKSTTPNTTPTPTQTPP